MSVAGADTSANESSPPSRNGEKGVGVLADITARGEENEPVPHLHAKTYLAVFTVFVIYYAQLVNLVGAGAVREPWLPSAQCRASCATSRFCKLIAKLIANPNYRVRARRI